GITSIRPYNTMQGAIAVPFEVQPVVTIEPEPPPTTGTLIYTPPVLGKIAYSPPKQRRSRK
ncbi:MAG TPA: hypothetical protein VF075_05365, partial [Pyrinomonadaceae bacterium]